MYFLSKISGRFYFRRRIPEDLMAYFPFQEIKKSLKTPFKSHAKINALPLTFETERIFMMIRSGMLTDTQIRGLIRQFIDNTLKDSEESRACGYGLPNDEDALDDAIDSHEELLGEYREALSFNQLKPVENVVDDLIQRNSLTIAKQSEDYIKLSREVLKAVIAVMQIEKERLTGNYENNYDRMLRLRLPSTSTIDDKPCKSLASIIDEYSREQISKKAWQAKTQAENAGVYNLLSSILTDVLNINTEDVKSLDRSILIKYAEVLSKLPANMRKTRAFRDLPLKEIYEAIIKKPVKPMATRSYNKNLERVSAMLKWASKQGYIERNPAEALTVKEGRVASKERDAYSKEDLQKLLNSPVFASPDSKIPEKFYIPLVALYGGLRLEEICQLCRDDIKKIDGVFCFDLNNEGDKRLKTASSKRIVPIHPALIDLGFLKFLKTVKGVQLWKNLKKGRDGFSDAFGKWYQRYNRQYITKNKKRVFHSFRHTFINNMKQQGIPETVIAELVGHSLDSITLSRYGKSYNVAVLADAVNKLDYGLDLSKLKFPLS